MIEPQTWRTMHRHSKIRWVSCDDVALVRHFSEPVKCHKDVVLDDYTGDRNNMREAQKNVRQPMPMKEKDEAKSIGVA